MRWQLCAPKKPNRPKLGTPQSLPWRRDVERQGQAGFIGFIGLALGLGQALAGQGEEVVAGRRMGDNP